MDTKKWYLSKGVWGSLIVVIVIVLRVVGQPEVATVIEGESETISTWIFDLATIVGAVIALYGRIKASKEITL